MISLFRETSRFSATLVARGILLVFLGITAISWPDRLLVGAMMTAAVLLLLFGLAEMTIALRARKTTRGWILPMSNGAACVGFALLTFAFPGFSLGLTLALVAVWLMLYAALTFALALALWPMRRTRLVLLAWTLLNVSLAGAAVFAPGTTIFTLLYVGAGYAVAFGALQVGSGMWMRRIAVPHVVAPDPKVWFADADAPHLTH